MNLFGLPITCSSPLLDQDKAQFNSAQYHIWNILKDEGFYRNGMSIS